MTNAPLAAAKTWFCIDLMRPGSVVSDKNGATVGVALDAYLWVQPDGRSSFLGKSILADDRITDLDKRTEALRKSLPSGVKRVELTFRAEKTQDRYAPPDEAQQGKAAVFGVVIDDQGTLFIPRISRATWSEKSRTSPSSTKGSRSRRRSSACSGPSAASSSVRRG